MKSGRTILFLCLFFSYIFPVSGQTPVRLLSDSPSSPTPVNLVMPLELPATRHGKEDDPGYVIYKTGYSYVLDEEWNEARSKFAEFSKCCPGSEFIDDALYWTAYSWLKSGELEKAIETYNDMLITFPTSTYYDDAIADLTEAQTQKEIHTIELELSRYGRDPDDAPTYHHDVQMRDLERRLRRLTWNYQFPPSVSDQDDIDPDTQLRIDALNALGDGADNEESFTALKDVAGNKQNPLVLREQALHILAKFEPSRFLPVLIEIARIDTNTVIRSTAIDYITAIPGESSAAALIELFRTMSPGNQEMSARLFYSIAEVGTDEAVDFLASVARNHDDMTLRREAVYYLGAIGSDRARSALHSIMRGK